MLLEYQNKLIKLEFANKINFDLGVERWMDMGNKQNLPLCAFQLKIF
jgi:hypothetical protein